MKNTKLILASALFGAISFTACKNDRGDDTHMDTTTVTSAPNVQPTPSPDSLTTSPGTTTDTTTAAPATSTPSASSPKPADNSTAGLDTRTRKTSRRGRIVLARLNNDMSVGMTPDKEGVYGRAEIMPTYPGGENELRKYIENHIQYPESALDNNTQGTVKVYFAVDEQGKIYSPTVISPKLGYGLEDEAIRVVKSMPRWTPGQIKGKNVKTRFTLPITYQISE